MSHRDSKSKNVGMQNHIEQWKPEKLLWDGGKSSISGFRKAKNIQRALQAEKWAWWSWTFNSGKVGAYWVSQKGNVGAQLKYSSWSRGTFELKINRKEIQ